MKSVLEVFWEVVLGITGAIALSALTVVGGAVALCGLAFGGACTLRGLSRRAKGKGRAPD